MELAITPFIFRVILIFAAIAILHIMVAYLDVKIPYIGHIFGQPDDDYYPQGGSPDYGEDYDDYDGREAPDMNSEEYQEFLRRMYEEHPEYFDREL